VRAGRPQQRPAVADAPLPQCGGGGRAQQPRLCQHAPDGVREEGVAGCSLFPFLSGWRWEHPSCNCGVHHGISPDNQFCLWVVKSSACLILRLSNSPNNGAARGMIERHFSSDTDCLHGEWYQPAAVVAQRFDCMSEIQYIRGQSGSSARVCAEFDGERPNPHSRDANMHVQQEQLHSPVHCVLNWRSVVMD
jgi:hypothetical protein